MKKCKVCGALTDTVFNINLKATPICEECARRIFLQQATWYSQQEFKNLALPQVSKSDSHEHGNTFCWINQEILLCKIRNNNFNTCRGCEHFKQNVC